MKHVTLIELNWNMQCYGITESMQNLTPAMRGNYVLTMNPQPITRYLQVMRWKHDLCDALTMNPHQITYKSCDKNTIWVMLMFLYPAHLYAFCSPKEMADN
jgi:hypothetical protein